MDKNSQIFDIGRWMEANHYPDPTTRPNTVPLSQRFFLPFRVLKPRLLLREALLTLQGRFVKQLGGQRLEQPLPATLARPSPHSSPHVSVPLGRKRPDRRRSRALVDGDGGRASFEVTRRSEEKKTVPTKFGGPLRHHSQRAGIPRGFKFQTIQLFKPVKASNLQPSIRTS